MHSIATMRIALVINIFIKKAHPLLHNKESLLCECISQSLGGVIFTASVFHPDLCDACIKLHGCGLLWGRGRENETLSLSPLGNVIPHRRVAPGPDILPGRGGNKGEWDNIFQEEERSKKCHQECTVLSKIIIMNYRDPIMFVYEGCLVTTIRLAT